MTVRKTLNQYVKDLHSTLIKYKGSIKIALGALGIIFTFHSD